MSAKISRRLVERFCAVALLILFAVPAQAQRQCDRIVSFVHSTATGPVIVVPGVDGKRIYTCGFSLAEKGPTLDIQIFTGAGPACAIGRLDQTPIFSFPNDATFNNRVDTVGPHSEYGDALCIQTFGSGAITGMIFWAQF